MQAVFEKQFPLHKDTNGQGRHKTLNKGNIVLTVDEKAPRGSWLMGQMTQPVPDVKGVVKQVQVQTKTSTICLIKIVILLEGSDGD